MAYSYEKARIEFVARFCRMFPAARTETALTLLREASAQQRWNEIECSIQISEEETARQEKREEARIKRVRALLETVGAELVTQGDPRGEPFSVKGPDDREFPIPGRGLPARCFR